MTTPCAADYAMPPRVCLAIASFQNDHQVHQLMQEVARLRFQFSNIIIVDSLGTAAMKARFAAQQDPRVQYHSVHYNLGSAGNLALRLNLSAKTAADFVLTLNHDGILNATTIERQIQTASCGRSVAAVYPRLQFVQRDEELDHIRRIRRMKAVPNRSSAWPSNLIPVDWGSSNGALYSLSPIRLGIIPWKDLWMGWEDLDYGIQLRERGYDQLVIADAFLRDDKESVGIRIAGHRLYIHRKPPWYCYYYARNLVLIVRRYRHQGMWPFLGFHVLKEALTSLIWRDKKVVRLELLARGFLDGFLGRTGQVVAPTGSADAAVESVARGPRGFRR